MLQSGNSSWQTDSGDRLPDALVSNLNLTCEEIPALFSKCTLDRAQCSFFGSDISSNMIFWEFGESFLELNTGVENWIIHNSSVIFKLWFFHFMNIYPWETFRIANPTIWLFIWTLTEFWEMILLFAFETLFVIGRTLLWKVGTTTITTLLSTFIPAGWFPTTGTSRIWLEMFVFTVVTLLNSMHFSGCIQFSNVLE